MKFYFSTLVVLMLGSFQLQAQDEFEEVQILDRPRYSLTDRITLDLDLTALPLDGYVKPILAEVALGYQLNDFIALEPIRFGWSFYNHDTGLEKSIEDSAAAQGAPIDVGTSALDKMKYHLSSAAFFNLLYSKSNLFNTGIVYHYWQVGGGVSYYNMDEESQLGLDLEMRVRFFLNDSTTFNIRGGHTIGFQSGAPDNITFLGLGVGFAF